jgi:hypothetical protein
MDDVALGFLSNLQAYVHVQPVKGAAAAIASPNSPKT